MPGDAWRWLRGNTEAIAALGRGSWHAGKLPSVTVLRAIRNRLMAERTADDMERHLEFLKVVAEAVDGVAGGCATGGV